MIFSSTKGIYRNYLMVLPNLKEIIQEDVMVCLMDGQKFLGYFPGDKMVADIKTGEDVPKDDPLHKTVSENRIVCQIVPEHVYGFPFKAVTFPVRDEDGKCIGAVGFAKSLEKEYDLSNLLKNLTHAFEEAKVSMESASSQLSGISANAQENSSTLEEVLGDVDELMKSAKIINDVVCETKSLSLKMKEETKSGEKLVNNITDIVKDISDSSGNVFSLMTRLNDSTKRIVDIVNLINQVSEQTNLLALNAAIEAARAGEQGKGFAVVADQVKKLSEQSKTATMDINTLVQQIGQETGNILKAITVSEERIKDGVDASERTLERIMGITEEIEKVDKRIEYIAEKSSIQSEQSEKISTCMKNVAESVNNTASYSVSASEQIIEEKKRLSSVDEAISSIASELVTV
ncbi:putative sensory transducer protein YfmS [Clostridium ljungdahlii DSM 13528]|uniref:Predicted chemotaxis sensory transducer n=3 Tax=Clostridium TaxID=1485 RepID=D8GPZ7_CLOLD|nr:methyl-accepting chemotaxis protein [Clostridium ljungdahlii]ADK16088.1 predicted chemotaxis sensory transducer [Clostridium ljungdahlii DSM 13528]OAA87037.1 putative sensory transducer protein YfmS [Clostridium ljungdahlii DSM 13528]